MPEDRLLAPMPRNLLDAMQAAGLDTAALAARLSIAPQRLETGLSRDEMDRFASAAWVAIGDPTFGLRAGVKEPRPERFSVVGFAAMTSPTLEVAFTRFARYIRLIWGDRYELDAQPDRATLRLLPSGPERPYTQGKLDFELASLATFGKTFTRQEVRPLQVGVRGKAPVYAELYAELLECPAAVLAQIGGRKGRRRPLARAARSHSCLRAQAQSPEPPKRLPNTPGVWLGDPLLSSPLNGRDSLVVIERQASIDVLPATEQGSFCTTAAATRPGPGALGRGDERGGEERAHSGR